jgi:ribonuclease HI
MIPPPHENTWHNCEHNTTFKPPEVPETLEDAFRLTLDKVEPITLRFNTGQKRPRAGGNREITVYTDGSCFNNGDYNARAGSGIHFPHGETQDVMLRLPKTVSQTNQSGELVAIIEAIRHVEENTPLCIKTDSKTTIDILTKDLEKNENSGWTGRANANLFKVATAELRARQAYTAFEWIKGHAGEAGNERADKLAEIGANQARENWLNLVEKVGLNPRGVKLQALTRSLAYEAIREQKTYLLANRPSTDHSLELAKKAVEDISGNQPTDDKIWRHTRDKALLPKQRQFLWRTIHNAYKVGRWWTFVQNQEEKAVCNCSMLGPATDDMEHILTKCESPGQNEVWNLAGRLWEMKGGTWPHVSIGLIMGAGQVNFAAQTEEGPRSDSYMSRLFRIIISESAYLIWLLRTERVIGRKNEKQTSQREIHNRWIAAINARIILDCRMTNRLRYRSKAIPPHIVKGTWTGVLKNEGDLPAGWEKGLKPGVLVGIEPLR